MNHDHEDDEDFEKLAWAAIKGADISERAEALLSLARVMLNENNEPDDARALALAAADLNKKRNNLEGQFFAIRVAADCYNAQNKHEACLTLLEEALALAEDLIEPQHIAATEHNIAIKLIDLNRPSESIRHSTRAAEIWAAEGNNLQSARAHLMVAQAQMLEKESALALEQVKKALACFKAAEAHFQVGDCYARLTDILIELGRIDEASDAHDKATAIVELLDIDYLKQQIKYNQARLYAGKGLHSLAVTLFDEGLAFFRAVPEPVNVCKITYERAKSLREIGDRDQALKDLKHLALFIDDMPSITLEVEQVYGQIWQLVDNIDLPLDGLETIF